MIFHPTDSKSGLQWLEPVVAAKGAKWDPPWTGGSSTVEPLTPSLTHMGTMETSPFTPRAHLWDVGGDRKTWRKATQAWGECANPSRKWL